MANYNFVIDSSFRPFDYAELVRPLMDYKEEYEKREADYLELQKNADKFKYLSETLPEGSKARDVYNTYANALQGYADDFAKNGLSINNKRGLLDMKRRYEGEVGRLIELDNYRKAQIKEQHEARLKDSTLLFSRDAEFTPFDNYLSNPQLGYKSYSGALLANQVGTAALKVAQEIRNVVQGKSSDYISLITEKYGYTPAEIAKAIRNPNDLRSMEVLDTIVNSVISSSGIPAWADNATLKTAYDYAYQGLWNAIGKQSVTPRTIGSPRSTKTSSEEERKLPFTLDDIYADDDEEDVTEEAPNQSTASGNTGSSGNPPRRGYTRPSARKAYGGRVNVFGKGGNTAGDSQQNGEQPDYYSMLDDRYRAVIEAMPQEKFDAKIDKLVARAQMDPETIQDYQVDSLLYDDMKRKQAKAFNMYYQGVVNEALQDPANSRDYTVTNIATYNDVANLIELQREFQKYKDYFDLDKEAGMWYVNKNGKDAYNRRSPNTSELKFMTSSLGTYHSPLQGSPFRQFVDRYGLNNYVNGEISDEDKAKMAELMALATGQVNTQTVATEFVRDVDSSQNNDLKNLLSRIAIGGKLPNFERVRDKENHTYVLRPGKSVNSSDVIKDFTGATVKFGKHGNYLEIHYGGDKKVIIPYSLIDGTLDTEANTAIAQAMEYLKPDFPYAVVPVNGKNIPVGAAAIRKLNAVKNTLMRAFVTSQADPTKTDYRNYNNQ